MTNRDRLVVAIVSVLVLCALAWFGLVQPKRGDASKLSGQIKSAQSQLDSAQAEVAQAKSAKATYAVDYTTVARLGEAVPADDNTGSLIYQLQSAANAAGVDFRVLQLNSSGASAPPPPQTSQAGAANAANSAANSSASKGSTSSTTPTTPNAPSTGATSVVSNSTVTPAGAGAAAPAPATQAATALLPPGATVGPAGFPVLPFTFTFTGNFFHLANFFGRLEKFVTATNRNISVSGRLMTLNAISLGPAKEGFPTITASISATTYLVPASQGVTGGASPTAPGAATTTPVIKSGSASPAPAAATPVSR